MEYLRGYRLFRDDPDWLPKVGILSLAVLSTQCVPFVGQFLVAGFAALLMRRAVGGTLTPMPRLDFDLNYLGRLLIVGLRVVVVQFVWSLPLIVLGGIFGVSVFIAAGLTASTGGGDASGGPLVCCILGGTVLFLPLMIAASVPLQIAAMRAALTDDIALAIHPRDVIEMSRALFRETLIGALFLGLVGFGTMIVGLVACVVGVFPAMALVSIAHAYFAAELYERWIERGGAPLPIAPVAPVEHGEPEPMRPTGWNP